MPDLPEVLARAFSPHMPSLATRTHDHIDGDRFEATYIIQFNVNMAATGGTIFVDNNNQGVVIVTLPVGYKVTGTAVEKVGGWVPPLGRLGKLLQQLAIEQIKEDNVATFRVSQPYGRVGIAFLVFHVEYETS